MAYIFFIIYLVAMNINIQVCVCVCVCVLVSRKYIKTYKNA